ncbi:(d)CMP kinase [Candidatus Methylocalor cossyra]|uniref:Cytidylate kinase n=1 Tax=Candidatus Methylocalor cossyra TaxID=3108543 RepID=A0ABM9NM72_9GAMM
MSTDVPVLTIDGPSGSGKGTVSRAVAQRLGWHFLDSGAIYRALAVAAARTGTALDDIAAIVRLAETMDLRFTADDPARILLDGVDISAEIPTESCGNAASRIAAHGPVRKALLEKQRAFRKPPGLVADGRDMGTVVFPDAPFKVFLTASAAVRAERRYKQLKEKGIDVNLQTLTQEIEERDRRDRERVEAPLVMAEGAVLVDSSDLTIEEAIAACLGAVRQ